MAIESSLWCLEEQELYKTVKPYKLHFVPTDNSFPQHNLRWEEHSQIAFRDIRSTRDVVTLVTLGFEVMALPVQSDITYEDCADAGVLERKYFTPLRACLQQHFGCDHVCICAHQTRKRHRSFPIYGGDEIHSNQPVAAAHIDFTPNSAKLIIQSILGEDSPKVLRGRYLLVNAWKRLNGPLMDWPLGLCDVSTVNGLEDLEKADVVSKHSVDESYQLYIRPHHVWYYLSEQSNSEVLLFRQYDSSCQDAPGVPHAAFPHPAATGTEEPRQSIEATILIWWD